MKIAASFLSCPKIKPAIEKLSLTDVEYIHIDLVDGTLNEGRKIPLRKLKKIYKYTSKPLDVHLMVKKPKKYIKTFASLNTETITFPIEIENGIEANIDLIHSYGIKCGIAINHDTEISRLKPFLDKIDSVLVMSIIPGYGGQKFIEETPKKISTLQNMIKKMKLNISVCVDGGINNETVKLIKNVNMIVVGSYITNSNDYQKQVDMIRKSIK